MLPILIVSSSQKDLDIYVESVRQKHQIPAHAIFYIVPEKEELTIGQIREVRKETILHHPYPRLFLLASFDHANAEAQNALLKTLEEQNERNLFILTASVFENVLPTIRSRAEIVFLRSTETDTITSETEALLTAIEKSPSPAFLGHPSIVGINREKAIVMLRQIILLLHRKLRLGSSVSANTLKKTMEIADLLQNNNLNAQMAVDTVLIFYSKQLHSGRA